MRVVVLGCGTGVGKTRLSVALLRELSARGLPTLGLKPVESGINRQAGEPTPPVGSDAAALAGAGTLATPLKHPLYGLPQPVSPHLAARLNNQSIEPAAVAAWVEDSERMTISDDTRSANRWTIVETAGGVFSPLATGITNFDLALRLEPASWVLVAADALGVLHEVTATLKAMRWDVPRG